MTHPLPSAGSASNGVPKLYGDCPRPGGRNAGATAGARYVAFPPPADTGSLVSGGVDSPLADRRHESGVSVPPVVGWSSSDDSSGCAPSRLVSSFVDTLIGIFMGIFTVIGSSSPESPMESAAPRSELRINAGCGVAVLASQELIGGGDPRV